MRFKAQLFSVLFLISFFSKANQIIPVFTNIVFYGGYGTYVSTPAPPAGVIRHRNDLNAIKLTDSQIALFGSVVTMNVTIKAACDNYDRLGNVNLAFVPKNAATYSPDSVQRIELGRFITPFMNKTKTPTTVPYTFDVSNISKILKESSLTAMYDFWIEFQVFGVESAYTITCNGKHEVFLGTLNFDSDATNVPSTGYNYIKPLAFNENFNNYTPGASDTIGLTIKTIKFSLSSPITNAELYLITSNHGANPGGEEYIRRNHDVYFDNNNVLSYIPGSLTCEPFRIYNTQGNGIYGPTPLDSATWQSFSNWCPGDKIPTRVISLGNLSAGNHSFRIEVPDAEFVDQEGNFPLSLYLQAVSQTNINGIGSIENSDFLIYPNPTSNYVRIESTSLFKIKDVTVFNLLGTEIKVEQHSNNIDFTNIAKGVYLLQVEFTNNKTITKKVIRN